MSMINKPKEMFKTYYTLFDKINEYDLNTDIGVMKYKVFLKNLEEIKALNEKAGTIVAGINQFTDMTKSEFAERYLIKRHILESLIGYEDIKLEFIEEKNTVEKTILKNPIDWTNMIPSVRNQGSCGSCWAFAAVGAIEGSYRILTGKSVNISEQFFVDCDNLDYGCNGGWPSSTLKWAIQNGVKLLADRPYTGKQGVCNSTELLNTKKFVKAQTFSSNQTQLDALLAKGPVITAMDASSLGSYYAPAGSLTPFKGTCTQINHAVVIVGKILDANNNCLYKVRNSWGLNWGTDKGHFYVSCENNCLMSNYGWLVTAQDDVTPPKPDEEVKPKPDEEVKPQPDESQDNSSCVDNFFLDCNFTKTRKAKNCDYFVNATNHFGSDPKGLNSSRKWYFYDNNHCTGKQRYYVNTSKKNICFNNFTEPYIVKSGHTWDLTNLKSDQIRLSTDHCLGGESYIVSTSVPDVSVAKINGSIIRSISFNNFIGTTVPKGIVFFSGKNYTGTSTTVLNTGAKQIFDLQIQNFESFILIIK